MAFAAARMIKEKKELEMRQVKRLAESKVTVNWKIIMC